jgi:threonylcarbamoyladenosine tRNA methylthiotransferase MtaB
VGCRTNQEEVFSLESELAAAGYAIQREITPETDVVIVNSCAVTAVAESKTRHLLAGIQRQAPRAAILVTGCLAQQSPQRLSALPGVVWVVGNSFKDQIPAILADRTRKVHHAPLDNAPLSISDAASAPLDPLQTRRTRFSVKIQEGCDFRCAYCIVPSLRGPSRCVPQDAVLAAAGNALRAGFRELVLTGTHIGQYRGRGDYGLVNLLDDLLALDDSFRIRLSSLDPRDISDGLVERIIREPRICRHLHVSVQSLDPAMLAAMNRAETDVQTLAARLGRLRQSCPELNIGGDFIVGFPGETEEMFTTTLQGVETAGFSYGHVFRFSPRTGTPAATMARQISDDVKKLRSELLRERLQARHDAFVNEQLGRTQLVLVEKTEPVSGLTSNYLRVKLPGAAAQRNRLLAVQIQEYDAAEQCCRGAVLGEVAC